MGELPLFGQKIPSWKKPQPPSVENQIIGAPWKFERTRKKVSRLRGSSQRGPRRQFAEKPPIEGLPLKTGEIIGGAQQKGPLFFAGGVLSTEVFPTFDSHDL